MKTLKTVGAIIIILILIPFLSWIFWMFKSPRPLNILVLDKTVLNTGMNEHRGLFWLLNNEKYVNAGNRPYNIHKDYYGFFPQKPLKERKYEVTRIKLSEIDQLSDSYDMTYYTDTYGVFFNEWYSREVKGRGTLIEGGLNNNDYTFLRAMSEKNKLIISEYNFLSPPTDGLVRAKTEELFGFRWTGWTGKYVHNLNTKNNSQLPEWVVDMYKSSNKGEWPFKGSGIILVHEGRKTVIVLESGKHLDEMIVTELQTTGYGLEEYDLPETVHFPNWFNIVENVNNQVVSEFKIHINMEGKAILDKYGLPSRFPAILASDNPSPYYYFAGDFADSRVKLCTARLRGIRTFSGLLQNNRRSSTSKFYWSYYIPLISDILRNYQASLQ